MDRHVNQREPGVVQKYFAPLDEFVKLRVFTTVESAQLLRDARIESKRHFIQLVVNAVVVDYHRDVLPRMPAAGEEALYALCVDLNPDLDIAGVTLPVPDEPRPLHLLETAPPERPIEQFRDIERALGERVIGQDTAVARVGRAVKKGLAGLRDPRRPIATFLFIGQTGVGKTELAKALSEVLYDDATAIVRIDCSEYAQPHETAKLIGAPPGYVGHDHGGALTEAMRRHADRVVLFDEIEKSDAKLHDLLLQIIDEGHLTDGKGRRASFSQAILVLTSNVGSTDLDSLRRRIGFAPGTPSDAAVADTLTSALHARFRPEFINRLSEIIVFNPIGLRECERISARMLDDVRRFAAGVQLTVTYARSVPRFLAERGYAPAFGARELRRTIEREVQGPLAEMLVDGELHEGDRVDIRVRGERLRFHRN